MQDPVPNVWEIVFSNISIEGGVVQTYVHGLLYGPLLINPERINQFKF